MHKLPIYFLDKKREEKIKIRYVQLEDNPTNKCLNKGFAIFDK